MAVAPTQGYQPQVSPGQSAPQPGASPEAFGADIGAHMADFGARLQEMGLDERRLELQRQRQVDAAQAGVDFARLSGSLEEDVQARRDAAAPDAAGHAQAVTEDAVGRATEFLSAIPNEQIRAAFADRAEELVSRVHGSESAWARTRRISHESANTVEERNLHANQLQNNPDPLALWQALDAHRESITQRHLPPDVTRDLLRDGDSTIASGYMNGRIEQDPASALAELHGGSFNDILTPAQTAHFTDAAQTEIRVREADQRRQLETARTGVREQVRTFQQQVNEHDPTVTPADAARVEAAATAAGLEPEAHNAHRWGIQIQADREFRNATPIEIAAEVGRLDERIARAGDHASPDDQIRRDQLHDLQGRRGSEIEHDPMGAYQRAGGHVAPIDPSDPASIRSRVATARAARAQFGGSGQILRPEEATILRDQVASGPAGRLQALGELSAIAGVDPQAARNAADQVAPGDRAFGYAVRSAPAVAQVILSGGDARHTLARVTRDDGTASTVEAEARTWFNANVAPALVHYGADLPEDILQASINVYAERRRQAGVLNNQDFDEGGFDDSVNFVLRNGGRGGGTGHWNGAPIVLPSGVDQREFERRMAFLPQGDQRWPTGSINGEPVWSDGRTISRNELRSQFVPVPIGDGVYQFRRGNELAMTRQRRPLQINMRLIAPPTISGAGPVTGASLRRRGDPSSLDPSTRPFWGAPPAPAGR